MQERVATLNLLPSRELFLKDVLCGLRKDAKSVPSKYFYDRRGCELFDQICELPEYYPTRTELQIMRTHIDAITPHLGGGCRIVEFGSGSSVKTRILLDHLTRPVVYVPFDIAQGRLHSTAQKLAERYNDIDVLPVCGDFTHPFQLPAPPPRVTRTVVYFPGSTIGNFIPAVVERMLRDIANLCGPGGGLLIGVDLKKDVAVLEKAYNDPAGVTAAFNTNLLHRLNRELEADVQIDQFEHRAWYNESQGRIEMHLVSLRDQAVRMNGERFEFRRGETICTEFSHKYDIQEFAETAARCGFRLVDHWTDPERLFAVAYFAVATAA